jgi:glycosyltransferase involved in cell wall biosynthesis
MVDISVVIPLYNEEESLPELMTWIDKVSRAHEFTYEVIMIDDGSTDSSWDVIRSLAHKFDQLRGIRFRRNYGKSAALNRGFDAAIGQVVVTMDADLQDSPEEIPGLRKMIIEEGFDLVSGWKKKRHDPIGKTLPSKFFNGLTRKISGIKLNDFNCGLKAYRLDVVKNIEIFGEMHRYIPVVAKWEGFNKIGEKVVQHQARKYGTSKFGLGRMKGVLDLLSITFVGKFGKKPMHFFGASGTILLTFGFLILIYLTIMKVIYSQYGIADRPLFYFGILLLIVGSQLFLTGFLAEMITRNSFQTNNYQISETLNNPPSDKINSEN